VEADLPADRSTTGVIAPGGAESSSLDFVGDRDWFRADLVGGHSYLVELDGSGEDPLRDPYLRVYDGDSSLVSFDDDSGPGLNSELILTATRTGNYYISAGAYVDRSEGGYTVTLTDLGPSDDFAGDASTSGMIDPNGTTTGEVETAGDRDWFALDVQAGAIYRFELEGLPTSRGTISDTTLHVRTAFGDSLAYNDDGGTGLNSLIEFEAPSTETVYLDAGGFSTRTGTYTLTSTLVSTGRDDHADDTSTSSRVSVNGSETGVLEERGDTDVFAIDLERGAEYRFSVVAGGTTRDPDDLSDATLTLLDPDGDHLAFNDDSGPGLDPLIEGFEPDVTGTHYLAVESFGDFHTGDYRIEAQQTRAPSAPDDYPEEFTFSAPTIRFREMTGTLEEMGDRDVIRLALNTGDTINFNLRGRDSGGGTLRDPYLRLYDGTGRQVAFNDDGGVGLDSDLTYTSPVLSTYFLEVAAFADGSTGTWLLESEFVWS